MHVHYSDKYEYTNKRTLLMEGQQMLFIIKIKLKFNCYSDGMGNSRAGGPNELKKKAITFNYSIIICQNL